MGHNQRLCLGVGHVVTHAALPSCSQQAARVGEEASYFLIIDKKNFSFIGSAQDHKRVGENETGPNTGGMGAYSPAPIIDKKLEKKIINKIVKPTLFALKKKI